MKELNKSVDVYSVDKSGARTYMTTINARGEDNLRNYLEKQGIRHVFIPVLSAEEKAEMQAMTAKLTQTAGAEPVQEQPKTQAKQKTNKA